MATTLERVPWDTEPILNYYFLRMTHSIPVMFAFAVVVEVSEPKRQF
jgi:hypothetical protein